MSDFHLRLDYNNSWFVVKSIFYWSFGACPVKAEEKSGDHDHRHCGTGVGEIYINVL